MLIQFSLCGIFANKKFDSFCVIPMATDYNELPWKLWLCFSISESFIFLVNQLGTCKHWKRLVVSCMSESRECDCCWFITFECSILNVRKYVFRKLNFITPLMVLSTYCNSILKFSYWVWSWKELLYFIGFEIQSRAFFPRKLFQTVSKLWVEIGFLWHLPSMENIFAWWEFLKWENANIFELIPEVAIFSKSAISQPNTELICQI